MKTHVQLRDWFYERHRMRRTAAQNRERLLTAAHELFYWNGIRATGIDKLAAEAGMTPTMLLYRLFGSKDELVAAYVERWSTMFRHWFSAAVDSAGPEPRARVLAVFDALAAVDPAILRRGCPFHMAMFEFPDPDTHAHQSAVVAKVWVRSRFGALAADIVAAGLGSEIEAVTLADRTTLISEGMYGSTKALGVDGPGRQARAFAEAMLPPTAR